MYIVEIQPDVIEVTNQTVNGIVTVETSSSPVNSVNGRTGAVTVKKEDLGLNRVDNTPDSEKPVSVPVSGALQGLENKILNMVQTLEDQEFEFDYVLPSGVESLNISYPVSISSKPKTVICSIENNVDEYIYNHRISNITDSGFNIDFSDFLSSAGYILHASVSR
jgi:hypothetical protein